MAESAIPPSLLNLPTDSLVHHYLATYPTEIDYNAAGEVVNVRCEIGEKWYQREFDITTGGPMDRVVVKTTTITEWKLVP